MVVRFRHGGKSDKKHVPHSICCEDKKQVAVMFWGCVSSRGEEALIPVLGTIDSVKYLPKTKNFDCVGRGDLTSLFFSKVAK